MATQIETRLRVVPIYFILKKQGIHEYGVS